MTPPAVPRLDLGFPSSSRSSVRSHSARSVTVYVEGSATANPLSARTMSEEEKTTAKRLPLSTSSKNNRTDASSDIEKLDKQVKQEEKPLSQMTMLERQAHFLSKKKAKEELQKAEKYTEEVAMNEKRNMFKARPVPSAATPLAPPTSMAVETKPAIVGTTRTASRPTSKWSVVKSKVKNGTIAKKASGKIKHVVDEDAFEAASAAAKEATRAAERAAAQAAEAGTALAEVDALISKGESMTGPTAMAALKKKIEVESGETSGEGGGPEEGEEEIVEATPAPYVPGEFWWKIEGGRGQHRVNDGSAFQMFSIFRKKDKTRDVKGVSMLVGRLERPPYEEKVIQMFFDVEEWTEETSFHWWHANSFRYTAGTDINGNLQVAHKPVPLLEKETEVLEELTKPKAFDALDPGFTADAAPSSVS
mmetsp:Transcript_65477/g.122538  ORF Transcript_65477/g.122538 Transcript_65477/m.122538 type:complete len:420 (+) Transcript_65477:1501-2760(+)